MALGCVPSPVDMFPYLETLRTLNYWRFMEASPCGCDRSLPLFPAPLPSPENEGG